MESEAVKRTLAGIGRGRHAFNPIGFPVPSDEYDAYIAPACDLPRQNPAMEAIVGFLAALDVDLDVPARTAAELEVHARALKSQHPG